MIGQTEKTISCIPVAFTGNCRGYKEHARPPLLAIPETAACYATSPLPDNDNRPAFFAQALKQIVRSPAIRADRDLFLGALRLHREKKRQRRVYHYSALTCQVRE